MINKLSQNIICKCCNRIAIFEIEELNVHLCNECSLRLYKSLAIEFVPRSIPNVIMRAEKMCLAKDREILQSDSNEVENSK